MSERPHTLDIMSSHIVGCVYVFLCSWLDTLYPALALWKVLNLPRKTHTFTGGCSEQMLRDAAGFFFNLLCSLESKCPTVSAFNSRLSKENLAIGNEETLLVKLLGWQINPKLVPFTALFYGGVLTISLPHMPACLSASLVVKSSRELSLLYLNPYPWSPVSSILQLIQKADKLR